MLQCLWSCQKRYESAIVGRRHTEIIFAVKLAVAYRVPILRVPSADDGMERRDGARGDLRRPGDKCRSGRRCWSCRHLRRSRKEQEWQKFQQHGVCVALPFAWVRLSLLPAPNNSVARPRTLYT